MHQLPEGFLEAKAEDLLDLLGKPSLIHLQGINPKPLFISTLLHGNETTGFYALQALLKQYVDTPLPRSLSIFIGNVEAAAKNQRRLESQIDYNRIWPGTHHTSNAETDLMSAVTNIMRKHKPFASIDVHNNTGPNPHYACVNILNPHGLQLASMFSNIAVYFTSPKGVQSSAFSDFCPAVVLECGQSGEVEGIQHAKDYLETVLTLPAIPSGHPENLNIFHTVASVTVPKHISFDTHSGSDVMLYQSLEEMNFDQLPESMPFAEIKSSGSMPFLVSNESDEDVTEEFFEILENTVILKNSIVLSMYTTQKAAIQQDCLCYFMEHLRLQP